MVKFGISTDGNGLIRIAATHHVSRTGQRRRAKPRDDCAFLVEIPGSRKIARVFHGQFADYRVSAAGGGQFRPALALLQFIVVEVLDTHHFNSLYIVSWLHRLTMRLHEHLPQAVWEEFERWILSTPIGDAIARLESYYQQITPRPAD
jgi:hypothetical protein